MWTSFAAYIFKKRLFQLFHRHNNNNNIIYSYLSLSYHSQDITEAYTMKFICNKTEISEAIGNVSRAVSQKSTIPALEGIKVRVSEGSVELTANTHFKVIGGKLHASLGYAELTAYNLEMGIRTSIGASTEGEGEFVVSARLFSEFTRRMSGDEITFAIDEGPGGPPAPHIPSRTSRTCPR